jgi:protease-4
VLLIKFWVFYPMVCNISMFFTTCKKYNYEIFLGNVVATIIGIFVFFMLFFFWNNSCWNILLVNLKVLDKKQFCYWTLVKTYRMIMPENTKIRGWLFFSENKSRFIRHYQCLEAAETDDDIKVSILNNVSSLGMKWWARDALEHF